MPLKNLRKEKQKPQPNHELTCVQCAYKMTHMEKLTNQATRNRLSSNNV